MNREPVDEPPSEVVPGFEDAWESLDRARAQLDRLREAWNRIGGSDALRVVLELDGDGGGRVCVTVQWPLDAFGEVERAAHEFAVAIKAAFDTALTAAARATSGDEVLELPMPLLIDKIEFDRWVADVAAGLLRPDQVGAVAQFQPSFGADAPVDGVHYVVHVATRQLVGMLDPDRGDHPRVAIWVHSARPQIELADGTRIRCEPSGDGPLRDRLVVGNFVPPPTPAVAGNPDCAFDPFLDDEPYPINGDDTLNLRSRMLVAVAAEFVRGMQRSTIRGYYDGLPAWLGRLRAPEPDKTWEPLDPGDQNAAEIHEIFDTSDIIVASYHDPSGNVSMLLRSGGTIFVRPLMDPLPLRAHAEAERGSAVEDASLGAAALWGLPDFVLHGKVEAKGNSTREIGDGTIITGARGLTIQVKARDGASGDPDREQRWTNKVIHRGARQARGTFRSLTTAPTELISLRGRPIVCDAAGIEWVGVVIIDHPEPPDLVPTIPSFDDLPIVVLTRGDWDFLFHHLRSATAVVDYLHRVAGEDPPALGSEPMRYFDLAQADEDMVSAPAAWTSRFDSTPLTTPTLPKEPVSVDDSVGHSLFRAVLETVATIQIQTTEVNRLEMLTLLDRLPVASRAAMGRLLLEHLAAVAAHPIGTVGWRFRRVMLDQGELQLVFGAGAGTTALLHEVLRQRTILWHEEMTQESGPNEVERATTIAVMVSPRYDGTRPWDTTTLFLKGSTGLAPDEVTALREFWATVGAKAELAG